MSLRTTLIIGLADEEIGSRVADAVQHVTGASDAVTVGATSTRVGVAGGTVAFFGGTGSTRATSAAVTDFATLKTALQNYGLIGT
jgi:hypothetical protein